MKNTLSSNPVNRYLVKSWWCILRKQRKLNMWLLQFAFHWYRQSSHGLSSNLCMKCHSKLMMQYRICSRRCYANGSWGGDLPTCERMTCPLQASPTNGRLVQDDATGVTSRVVCHPRHRLEGTERWTCLLNGTWLGEARCILSECAAPDPPLNGVVSGTDFK